MIRILSFRLQLIHFCSLVKFKQNDFFNKRRDKSSTSYFNSLQNTNWYKIRINHCVFVSYFSIEYDCKQNLYSNHHLKRKRNTKLITCCLLFDAQYTIMDKYIKIIKDQQSASSLSLINKVSWFMNPFFILLLTKVVYWIHLRIEIQMI